MSRYRFELAGPADDADLRDVLANTPMPGQIALTFRREPSFFAGACVEGFQRQIVACRELESGRIVGFGCRSLRRLYVNGAPRTIGYLSSIRLLTAYRNQGLVARGYRFFRNLHADGQTALYLTTIAESNEPALRILASGRAGLPTYHAATLYHTMALPIGRRAAPNLPNGLIVRPAATADGPTIISFLQQWGPRRQFFPCYESADFNSANGGLFGLRADDVLCAWRGDQLVGLLAGWDQSSYRQAIVHSYHGLLRWLRPVYNGWAWLRRRPGLPSAGQAVRYVTAALPIVADDEATTFDALLQSLLARLSTQTAEYLVIALAEDDPLLPVLQRYGGTRYTTRLFHVCWADGESDRLALDGRPAYLELGSL